MIGRHVLDLVVPEEWPLVLFDLSRLCTAFEADDLAYTLVRRDGDRVFARLSAKIVLDGKSRPKALLWTARAPEDRSLAVDATQAGSLFAVEEVDLAEVVQAATARLAVAFVGAGSMLVLHVAQPVTGVWPRAAVEQLVDEVLSVGLEAGRGRPIEITVEAPPSIATLDLRSRRAAPGLERNAFPRLLRRARLAGARIRLDDTNGGILIHVELPGRLG
jgi:hypothetical protein